MNRVEAAYDHVNTRMGKSNIWVGEDVTPYSTSLKKCSADMFDTGFYPMSQPCSGSRVVIRRDGQSLNGDTWFNIMGLRLY